MVARGNAINGAMLWGMDVNAGVGSGGRSNRVSNVRIEDNVIRSGKPAIGVLVWTGDGNPDKNRHSAGNVISGLVIEANRISLVTAPGPSNHGYAGGGGVVLMGGFKLGRDNVVRDVRIARNSIRNFTAGISVIGGIGPTARRNRVICVPLVANRIRGARTQISVRSNVDGAAGNRASLRC